MGWFFVCIFRFTAIYSIKHLHAEVHEGVPAGWFFVCIFRFTAIYSIKHLHAEVHEGVPAGFDLLN
jgi:hypothetical protein